MINMIKNVVIPASYDQLESVRSLVEQTASEMGMAPDVIYDLTLAITEVVTNVIMHGYRGKPGIIEITFGRDGSDFILQVRDEAPAFDPNSISEPDITAPLDQRVPGGLGIFLTKKLVDSLTHHLLENGGNEITLVKRGQIKG